MKDRARVVVVGAGIAGSSIAYHLAELGWNDVLVLEQGEPAGGTTGHAPGLVGQLRSSASLTKMLMHSVALYKTLRFNGEAGFFPVGSLRLASSKDRLLELKRQAGFAKTVGLEARLLTPRETLDLFPLMDPSGVEGALHLPTDGSARAPVLAKALAEGARAKGAVFVKGARVTGFRSLAGRLLAVRTDQGEVECETCVLATGVWTPEIASQAGIHVPLVPMQHQYVMTAPLPELRAKTLPNLRDPDLLVYCRQDGEALVLGGYERDPAPFYHARVPARGDATVLDFTSARFEPLLEGIARRVPAARGVELVKKVNGLESFTPDGEFLLGESPALRGLWLACGFCAHGVSGAGGVGRMIAEWIVHGEPSLDLWHMDARRFGGAVSRTGYVAARAAEVVATYYDVSYPGQERQSQRGLRLSPAYPRLKELGAVFGEKNGWERPNWFARNEEDGKRLAAPSPRGLAARHWSAAIAAEHQACRERVALFDETSFSKMEISGPKALDFLQSLTDNQLDQPVGSVVYTQLLNDNGGIECDLTVTRLAADRFRLITGTSFGVHDQAWLARHLPSDGSAAVRDVTDELCCLGVWGPRARDLLASLSRDDVSNAGFPYMTGREIGVGPVQVLALRVTYVGELGWELYARLDDGLKLWDALWEAGKPLGLVAAGYRAIDSLRLEKGYRYWSADIHSEYHPYEAGLGFCVKLAKGEFKGRAALERLKARGLSRKLCCLTLKQPDAVCSGGEAVMTPEGRIVGRVTSGGYGYTVQKSIAYAYLPLDLAAPGTPLEVELYGDRVPAVVEKEPLYDPVGAKIKS